MRPDEIVQGIDIGASRDAKGAGLIATAPAITHAELTERLQANGVVRGAILEAQDDSPTPKYAVYFLTSWRRGYCILHVHYPERPRLFRDLDRLMATIRSEYGFTGAVAVTRASETSGRHRYRVLQDSITTKS